MSDRSDELDGAGGVKEFDRYAAVVFWGVVVHKLRTATPRLHVAIGVSRLRRGAPRGDEADGAAFRAAMPRGDEGEGKNLCGCPTMQPHNNVCFLV